MHPALSVIFFTTLSGAGYGLLFWTALGTLFRWSGAGVWLACAVLGLALVTLGLFSSVAHLGQPLRAWRAFSQWRTSWLSREGVVALATYVPAVVLAVLLWREWADPASSAFPRGFVALACLGTALASLATVVCTAMIYASLKPIPAWRHRAVVPVYLLFSLLTGGLLCAAFAAFGGGVDNRIAPAVIVGAVVLAVAKKRYWRDIDTSALPATRADAIGLPGRTATVFERPHTEANYLTREMGFVVARRHSRRLRGIALALFAAAPLLMALPVWFFVHLDAGPWLAVAAIAAVLGAFVERWLFFAEARHLVTLYY